MLCVLSELIDVLIVPCRRRAGRIYLRIWVQDFLYLLLTSILEIVRLHFEILYFTYG